MRNTKGKVRKFISLHNRIENLGKLMDEEDNPVIRQHYRNVLKQLQTQLELI